MNETSKVFVGRTLHVCAGTDPDMHVIVCVTDSAFHYIRWNSLKVLCIYTTALTVMRRFHTSHFPDIYYVNILH